MAYTKREKLQTFCVLWGIIVVFLFSYGYQNYYAICIRNPKMEHNLYYEAYQTCQGYLNDSVEDMDDFLYALRYLSPTRVFYPEEEMLAGAKDFHGQVNFYRLEGNTLESEYYIDQYLGG